MIETVNTFGSFYLQKIWMEYADGLEGDADDVLDKTTFMLEGPTIPSFSALLSNF